MSDDKLTEKELAQLREVLKPHMPELQEIVAEAKACRAEVRAAAEKSLLTLETLTTRTIH